MSAPARPFSSVPRGIALLLAAAIAAQLGWQALGIRPASKALDIPPAPAAATLRAASFGEPEFAARTVMLYLQSFDLRGDNPIAYQHLDYGRLVAWLRLIVQTDPRSAYALFSGARIYAENADPVKCRAMLEFLHEAFEGDPDRRWPWLAHAALIAKHQLRDLPLALHYARAIDGAVRDPQAPLWARQMEIFVLEEMNELEAAKVMLGGLIASRRVRDPELHFLQARLKALELRLAGRD